MPDLFQIEAEGDQALTDSTSHYQSEQDLFSLPPPTPEPERDFVDVASFLEMGHVPNCWCRPCQNPSEDNNEDLPELINFEDVGEEWMVCSSGTAARSPSVCSAWEWEWGTVVGDDYDADDVKVGCAKTPRAKAVPTWDEMFPPLPSAKTHGA